MLKDYFAISMNNLTRRKLRSWLTMIGIFIGIAAVISLISLGQGLQSAVSGQFSSLSTDMLTIQNSGTGLGPPGSTVVVKLNDHDLKIIGEVRGVKEIIPRLIRIVEVKYNRVSKFKYIGSMPENKIQSDIVYSSFNAKTEEGRLLTPSDRGKVVLGSDVITKEEFDKEISAGKSITIEDREFEVVGIMEKSSTFELNQVILMQEEDLKDILEVGDEIDLIIVKVEDSKEIEEVGQRIEKALRKDRGEKEGEEDFSVQTPLEALSSVNAILSSVNIVVIGIAMISLIVGGIGIANTMYTSVLERQKEIGTMKAIGAKNSDILSIFLIESGLLGLVGGIIGVMLGVLLSWGIAAIANNFFGSQIITVNNSPLLLLSAVAFSFLIGVLSGLIPSYQASRLKPVEALRGVR